MDDGVSDKLKKKVLITGAGTLGTALVKGLFRRDTYDIDYIVVVDHSEDALWRLEEAIELRDIQLPKVLFYLGDVRDKDRMKFVMKDMDIVFHTAALKHVWFTEGNPVETVETNVTALANMLVEAVESPTVKTFVNMSSDKACSPSNIYGETKKIGERLTHWAYATSGKRFFSARSGNFLGSRGSVLDRWKEQRQSGEIQLTDRSMSRFFIKPREVASFLITLAMEHDPSGCIVTPFLKSANMGIMADVLAKRWDVTVKEVGAKEGEKMDEMIINHEEASRTIQTATGWWTYPCKVSYPVGGAISTAIVPCMGKDETANYLEGF